MAEPMNIYQTKGKADGVLSDVADALGIDLSKFAQRPKDSAAGFIEDALDCIIAGWSDALDAKQALLDEANERIKDLERQNETLGELVGDARG